MADNEKSTQEILGMLGADRKMTDVELESIQKIYSQCVEMADRVSQRRQTANSFYLTINTLFISAVSISAKSRLIAFEVLLLGLAGILICGLWLRNIHSYKDLNSGKFAVINTIETLLPIRPYSAEWQVLERGQTKKRYRPFHKVETLVPVVFIVAYLVCIAFYPPWSTLFPW